MQQCEVEIQTSPILYDAPKVVISPPQSLQQSLSRSITSPLTRHEEQVHTHLTKRKLRFAGGSSTIRCKTGGQPLILKRLIKPRKLSTEIKSPLKRRRAKEMSDFRACIAGGDVESQQLQQSSELKVLPKSSRLNVCSKAGVKQKSYLNKKVALAMKTSLGLSWSQHRQQKRFLSKMIGVQCENVHFFDPPCAFHVLFRGERTKVNKKILEMVQILQI